MVQPGAADRVEVGQVALEPGERLLLDSEAEARLVPGRPQDASGVILERAGVEDADAAGLKVCLPAGRIEQPSPFGTVQPQRHRVDREVASQQVLVDRRGLHVRESARPRVRLRAGCGQVDREALAADRRGAESGVGLHSERAGGRGWVRLNAPPTEDGLCQCDGISFDCDVDIQRRMPQQEVAQRAADQVRGNGLAASNCEHAFDGRARLRREAAEPFVGRCWAGSLYSAGGCFIDKFWVFWHRAPLL